MKMTIIHMMAAGVMSCCMTCCGAPEQKVKLKVTDESGKPLEGVDCMAGFTLNGPDGKWKDTSDKRKSGPDGIAELQGETLHCETLVRVTAPGYYKSETYRYLMTGKSGNRWEPWPVEVNLVMKKIVNPHPMHACKNGGKSWISIPEKQVGQPFGYDLFERDWVAPHGKGRVADVLLTGVHETPGDTQYNPKCWIRVTFPGPDDGVIEYCNARAGGSVLRGPQMAPESGYSAECRAANFRDQSTGGQTQAKPWSPSLYVIRTRTKKDEQGKITTAFYGKIAGDLRGSLYYQNPKIFMTYYINGTANERNLEWDMKNNLFKELDTEYWPKEP